MYRYLLLGSVLSLSGCSLLLMKYNENLDGDFYDCSEDLYDSENNE